MITIADIHCHVLPYVDDGAEDKNESLNLLKTQFNQGARIVCCTPHLRKGMFETPDELIYEQFDRLQERCKIFRGQLKLFLSREYYCDSSFIQRLEEGNVIPYGNGNYLLVEFSSRYEKEQFFEFVRMILSYGYRPLVAHVERYPKMQDVESIQKLIKMGCKIQINAGSLLGREGIRQAMWVKKLLKLGLVDVIASDAHDTETRPPEMDKAASYVTRKLGKEEAKKLFYSNQMKILQIARRSRNGID